MAFKAFVAAFLGYWLIKWLPLWGLSLLSTTVLYLGPLIYIQNQEFIDTNIQNAGEIINKQAAQVKNLAAQTTGRASETMKSKAGEYSQKAQEMLGSAKSTVASKMPNTMANHGNNTSNYKRQDFPEAPREDPVPDNFQGERAEPVLA